MIKGIIDLFIKGEEMFKKFTGIFLCLVFILQALPVFADAEPEVVDYKLYDSSNVALSLMNTGDKAARLEMTLTDSGVKTNEIANKDAIDVIGVSGCFGSTPTASKKELLSSGSDQLMYKLTFNNVTYTGGNQVFSFKIKYRGTSYVSNIINLKINECNIGANGDVSTKTDESGNTTYSIPAPPIDINRSDLEPIKPGSEFEVEFLLKNRGRTTAVKPIVTFSTQGDVNVVGSSTVYISDINAGATSKVKARFYAEEKMSTASQQITVNVKYTYNSGSAGNANSECTDVVSVPAVVRNETGSPVLQIVRGDIPPVEADTNFVLPVTVKNAGNIAAKDVVVSITADEGLMLQGSSIQYFEEIPAKSEEVFNISLRTDDKLSDSHKNVSCEAKYNYTVNKENSTGDSSAKLIVPLVPNTKENPAPLVKITHSGISDVKEADKAFAFNITVKNVGSTELVNAMLNVEGAEDVIIAPSTSGFDFASLKPGESKTFTVKAKTVKKLTSSLQTLNAELKYSYVTGKTNQSGNEAHKIQIPLNYVKEEDKMKASTPNVIIENYSYGSSSVATGEEFLLDIGFKNKGGIEVQNLTMTLEPSEAIAITTGTNTFFYEKVAPGAGGTQQIKMFALPNADKSSSKVNVTFKYEYVDNKTRSEATSTQSVSIPLYKPDLLEFTPPTMQTPGVVGEEYPFTIEYVNKGKGEVCNVRAEVLGDVETVQRVQNLGNFEAGKSGNINFIVTPMDAGKNEVSVKITYEDSNLKQKERIFNLSYEAQEEMMDMDMDMMEEEEEPTEGGWKKPAAIAAGIIAAIVALILIIKAIKKRKKSFKVNWEDKN